jgi:hypothetical protein
VRQRPKQPREPDIALLLVMIAFACIATMGELALVVEAPTWVVWVAAVLPVCFWAILLREVHRFLRVGEPEDAPSWTSSVRRFLMRRRARASGPRG